LFRKTKNILIPIIALIGLLLANASISHAEEIVLLKLECAASPNGENKAYTSDLTGVIDGRGIAIARAWFRNEWRFGSMTGYIKGQHLVIKGDVSWEKKQGSFPMFFKSPSYGNILDDLKKGVRGFEGRGEGKANCTLKLQDVIASGVAFASVSAEKKLRSEVRDLKRQLTEQTKAKEPENDEAVEALKNKITELNTKIANLEKSVSLEAAPSENLIQMATVIASLKDELLSKSELAENLEGQIAGLKREVQTTKDGNISRLENLEAQLSKKDEDIRSLTVALQTLQDMPATQASCPEPVASSETGENNDPIIKYLENKNAELTAKLKNCSAGSVKAKSQKAPVKPQTKKEPSVTNVIFENKWQLSDAVKCSSGSYTVYDKTNGDVFVSNGEKRISPNPTEVKITQLSNNRIKIDKKIFSNDMDKQRNGGRPFVVLSSTEEITVLSEKQILTDKTLKRLNFNRFMSNPSDKVYDTIKEGRKTSSCGLLPGVKNNSQASSSTAPKKKEPKTDPFALPKGKFEAATFCAGVLTYVAEDNFIKQTPALSTKLMSDAMRHVQASGILSQRGIRGENMIAAAMQKLNDTIGPTVEEVEIKRGSPLHGLILKCGSLDALK
jgi:gas vesicle protein